MAVSIDFSKTLTTNLQLVKGDTLGPWGLRLRELSYDWSSGAGTSIKMQIRSKPLQDPALVTLTPAPVYPQLGDCEFTIEVAAATMEGINAGKYFYDIEVTRPDGVKRTYIAGSLSIIQDVTR